MIGLSPRELILIATRTNQVSKARLDIRNFSVLTQFKLILIMVFKEGYSIIEKLEAWRSPSFTITL